MKAKNKYHKAIRILLLVFTSAGIFISCFHSHSDLQWNHSKVHCATGIHISASNIHCPVCAFHLDGTPAESASPMTVQNVISVIHKTAASIAGEQYTGPLTGRSPPTLG